MLARDHLIFREFSKYINTFDQIVETKNWHKRREKKGTMKENPQPNKFQY